MKENHRNVSQSVKHESVSISFFISFNKSKIKDYDGCNIPVDFVRLSASYQSSDDKRKGGFRYLQRVNLSSAGSIYSSKDPTDFVGAES